MTEAAQCLPSHKPYDHGSYLQDGQHPPWGPMYPLSETKLEVPRNWLKHTIATGKIRKSTSPAAVPILLAQKPPAEGLGYFWITEVFTKSRLQINTNFH
jgi:hypothetical protein